MSGRALVFATRGRARAADAFADGLRSSGRYDSVARHNSRWYEGEQHKGATVLYHDGSVPWAVEVHEKAGVAIEFVDFGGQPVPPLPPAAEVEEEAALGPEAEGPAYRMEYKAPWHSIYGPDDRKVGKSFRNRADAEAKLEELNDA